MPELAGLAALEIAAGVRARRFSAREVLAAHLARFAAADPLIHAFQGLRAEAALREADALDARADLEGLPLAGVPVAIKDQVDIAGEPTRFGSAASSPELKAEDSVLVRRLRDAGCLVIGKATVPELMIFPFTESEAFGVTRNPWDRSRTPGGSSGGSAAAVAAGIVPLALGSDGGGSIRIPAAACGLLGLKPGPGVVPEGGGWYGNSEFGPLATTAADLAQMLAVLAGRAELAGPTRPGRRLRIALSRRPPAWGTSLQPAVLRALEETADALRGAGHRVVESDPPYPQTLSVKFLRRFLSGIADEAQSMRFGHLERRTQAMVRAGARWRRGLDDRDSEEWHARAAGWLSDFDLMLSPVLTRTAPPVETWKGKGWVQTVYGVTQWMAYTPAWNLARMPCAAVPAGIAADGLPVSVQLLGPRGSESLLLSVAAELEALRPWQRLAPL